MMYIWTDSHQYGTESIYQFSKNILDIVPGSRFSSDHCSVVLGTVVVVDVVVDVVVATVVVVDVVVETVVV